MMVLVIGKHKLDVSRPFAFCGKHKVVLMLAVVLLVLSMSASVCALQSGGTLTARPAAATTASNLSGGRCPTYPHHDLNYRARYNYAAFNNCDWFMTFLFTNVTEYMTDAEVMAVADWVIWFADSHDGFVRFPAYKRLWSRSEIGQPI